MRHRARYTQVPATATLESRPADALAVHHLLNAAASTGNVGGNLAKRRVECCQTGNARPDLANLAALADAYPV